MSSNSQISNYIYQAHQAHKANDIKDFENLVSILLSFRPFQASTLKQIIVFLLQQDIIIELKPLFYCSSVHTFFSRCINTTILRLFILNASLFN